MPALNIRTLHRSASALVVMLVLSATPASAATYYVGPDGDDGNAGTSAGRPLATFETAAGRLAPGDTLVVLDGTYESTEGEGRLVLSEKHGTEERPIVIEARHERRAWLKGDGYLPALDILSSSWIVVNGLRVSGADNADPGVKRGRPLRVVRSEHVTLRRLLVHNSNRYENSQGIGIALSKHVLVEETELYNYHRNGISAWRSADITYRRCYANSHGYADLDDGYQSHNISDDGGDRSFLAYHGSRLLVENSISEDRNEGFGFISGLATPDGVPSGDKARFLGVISLHDNVAGAVQSRNYKENELNPVNDVRFENYLMANSIRRSFISRAAADVTMEHVTALNVAGSVFWASTDQAGRGGKSYWPSCKEIGGCTFRMSNWLVANSDGVLEGLSEGNSSVDLLMSGSNFWQSQAGEAVSDAEGYIQNSTSRKPSRIGLGEGECAVFVPESSNMSGAGKDGEDLGANILYRYEDGELTDEPLWDPATGEFPHGAVIEGSPNDPAKYDHVAANVHERLNVNTNGCRLPYAVGSDRENE